MLNCVSTIEVILVKLDDVYRSLSNRVVYVKYVLIYTRLFHYHNLKRRAVMQDIGLFRQHTNDTISD